MTFDFSGLFGDCFALGFAASTLAALVGMGIRGIIHIFHAAADVPHEL